MARETLKDFLRSGAYPKTKSNPDGVINYTLDELVDPADGDSSGLAFEYNTGVPLVGFDAKDTESGLVGNFLHYISEENNNFYEFKKGNQETYAGNRGDSLQDQDSFLAVPPYVAQGTTEDSLLDSYSNSGYFDDPSTPNVDELFDIISKVDGAPKGEGENAPRGANDLLKGVFVPESGGQEEDFVVKATVQALKRNNRFNMEEDEGYLNKTESISQIDSNEDYNFVKQEKDYYTSLEKLKDVGASQILKASGYDITNFPLNSPDQINKIERLILDDVEGPANEIKVQMPGNVDGEEVPKIPAERLLGMNATGVPKDTPFTSVRKGTGVDIPYDEDASNSSSFGVTYNSAIRFEDITKTHKIKTALRLISLFNLIKSVYGEIIEALAKEDKKLISGEIKKIAEYSTTANAGALILGQSRKSNKFIASNYLFDNFLTPTDFAYEECFKRGVEVILGTKESDTEAVSDNVNTVYGSPGFWLAISNVAIKKTFIFSDKLQRLESINSSGEGARDAIKTLISEFANVAKIANVFAIIGEKSLHHTNGITDVENVSEKVQNVRDVDSLDNIPGNRVGKSRKTARGLNKAGSRIEADIGSETSLAWEQSAVPSMYLLPLNIFRAAADLNNTVTRANPARGMLGSRMVRNTYTGLDTDGSAARIPNRVVKIIEDRLEAEYVPFYIQDLRTNEIISFHAFLTQLNDSITPNYDSIPGFGRIDAVKAYQNTTRQISVNFTLYATNREDFDEMWYKINKLVTLLYPQWTQGQIVQSGEPDSPDATGYYKGARFVQPFSQTIGSTPLVRLRVGDVIKSNYSRFALARTFGIGDSGIKAQPYQRDSAQGIISDNLRNFRDAGITIFGTLFGSPQGLIQIAQDNLDASDLGGGGVLNGLANLGLDAAADGLAEILINGFVNPLLAIQTISRLRDPNVYGDTNGYANVLKDVTFVYINPNMIDGYQSEDGERFFTSKRLIGRVLGTTLDETGDKIIYRVRVADRSDERIKDQVLLVRHENIWNDPAETFNKSFVGGALLLASGDIVGLTDLLTTAEIRKGGLGGSALNLASEITSLFLENPEAQFMRPEVNPFVRAFDSTKGRGLAGVIGGINFNWLDEFPWETDFNARAPIGCNISFNFDVIHDIPPGLDHTGYNRAPLYNVGEIMKNAAGDVYDEKFSKAETLFRRGGAALTRPGKHITKTGEK